MSAHAVVLALLQASADLVELVGARITPDQMDDPPVYPAVTFQKVGGGAERRALTNPGLMWARFQVSSWAKSRDDVVPIANQVRKALDRQRKVTVAGVRVDDSFYEDDLDLVDDQTGVCFNHMSFKIHYRENP